ncbi:hypothetical protein MPER_05611, partial [Moniliophthora perniciosa FA553]
YRLKTGQGSIPERDNTDDNIYNTCTVYSPKDIPGKITFKVGAISASGLYFPQLRLIKESETLTGGKTMSYFDTEFARIGLGICYDARFPELASIYARQGAFNLTTGPLHWELLQRSRAIDNQIYFSMCSPARDLTAGYHAWGHSMVVDPMGKVLAEAQDGEEIIYTDIDPTTFEETRKGIPVTTQHASMSTPTCP